MSEEEEGQAKKRQKLGPTKEEEEALTLDHLPDEVLQMILFATGWPYIHVREVCTRWKTAIDSRLKCTQCGELKRTVCTPCDKKGCRCSMRRCVQRYYEGIEAKQCPVTRCLECIEESQQPPDHDADACDLVCCDVCRTAWMCVRHSGDHVCERCENWFLCANCAWQCQQCGQCLCADCAQQITSCCCSSRVLCRSCSLEVKRCPGGCGISYCPNCCNSTCEHCDRLTCSTPACLVSCPQCGEDWCRECEEDNNCHHV